MRERLETFCERRVKVFNSSVENHVEMTAAKFEIALLNWVSCSLHKFGAEKY
jgi:hypothetical protein